VELRIPKLRLLGFSGAPPDGRDRRDQEDLRPRDLHALCGQLGAGYGHRGDQAKRRTDVVSIFPNEAAVLRLVSVILLEQSDKWATQRSRYMTLGAISAVRDTGYLRLSTMPG
jgi:hypothetical protein